MVFWWLRYQDLCKDCVKFSPRIQLAHNKMIFWSHQKIASLWIHRYLRLRVPSRKRRSWLEELVGTLFRSHSFSIATRIEIQDISLDYCILKLKKKTHFYQDIYLGHSSFHRYSERGRKWTDLESKCCRTASQCARYHSIRGTWEMGKEANWRILNESRGIPPLRSPYTRLGLIGHLNNSGLIWTGNIGRHRWSSDASLRRFRPRCWLEKGQHLDSRFKNQI